MEFTEMKKIWDEQNKQPLFAVNEEILHQRVLKDKEKIKRMVGTFEWSAFLTISCLALFMIAEGVLDNELYQVPEGILLIITAGFIYWSRLSRIRNEDHSGDSILADIRQSIRTIDYQIRRQRYFAWWFTTPILITMIIHFIYTYQGKPWWLWLAAALFFIFQHWLIRKEIRCKYQPKRENLVALQNLLLEK